jgi:hypothetical protein
MSGHRSGADHLFCAERTISPAARDWRHIGGYFVRELYQGWRSVTGMADRGRHDGSAFAAVVFADLGFVCGRPA